MKNSMRQKYLAGTSTQVIMILLTLVTGPAWSAENWDMAAAYPAKDYITSSYIAFAKKVTKHSGGALKIKVHASGSLVKGAEIFSAVGSGRVAIGGLIIGAHADEDPIFGVDTVPFLATDVDEAWQLYQVSKNALAYALKQRNMHLLFTAVWPPQGLFINRKVDSLADMKGVKFRAYDDNTERLAELVGAIPIQTEATEIKQAFSTGLAESMISSSATGVFYQMWEHVEYFYEGNAWYPKSVVVVNLDVWNGLDGITREVLVEQAAKAEKSVWAAMVPANSSYKKTMTHNGIKVRPTSSKLRKEFKKIGETLSTEWAEAAGDRGKQIIADYDP
jgi:TRAP-type C4-dicarboxylate transport system substrate-binding protein